MDHIFSRMTPQQQEHMYLEAAIGAATRTSGMVDLWLVQVLNYLLDTVYDQEFARHLAQRGFGAPPSQVGDPELASIILFSHISMGAKFSVVRDVMKYRFERCLQLPQREYQRKVAEFLLECLNATETEFNREKWIRNVAAHGSTSTPVGQPPTLIPSPYDAKALRKFAERTKKPALEGLTAEELLAFVQRSNQNTLWIEKLGWAIKEFRAPGQSGRPLEERLLELGKGLKLRAPLRNPPKRARRQGRAAR